MDKETSKPICPQCGNASMTLFTPLKQSLSANPEWRAEAKKILKGADKIDWEKAHLYCNRDLNCTYEFPLYTPIDKPMNLKEIVRKNISEIYECNVDPEEAQRMGVQHATRILEEIIKRLDEEASEYVNDEQAGRTGLAYDLYSELSVHIYDISALQ